MLARKNPEKEIAKSVNRPHLRREQLQRSLAKQHKPARALTQLNDLPY